MRFDGSGFEASSDYVDADNTIQIWRGTSDINDSGDVTGMAVVRAKQTNGKFHLYLALWPIGSDQIIPAGNNDAWKSDWLYALTNNDRDFLLSEGSFDIFWHNEWSAANGAIKITDLIDPDDPNRNMFNYAFEMTDHRANDWPTIIAVNRNLIDIKWQLPAMS